MAVKQLCSEVLAGEITLDDFEARRHSTVSRDQFLEQVLEDLEDGIVHTPGRLLRKGPDRGAWERSSEYFVVYLDWCLLDHCVTEHTTADLLRCRAAIEASREKRSTESIRRSVEQCLARCASGPPGSWQ